MGTGDFEEDAAAGIARAQAVAGEAVDEAARRAKGEARSFADKVDPAAARAKQALGRAADHARSAASSAADTYGDLRRRAAAAASDTVDPFVRENPYATIAVSVIVGLVLGLLLFGGGTYVKSARG